MKLTTVECAFGDRAHELADTLHVGHVAAGGALVWNKESMLNIGISRLPDDARYTGTFDADIEFRKIGCASETVRALQRYAVVQPWSDCYDLCPTTIMSTCTVRSAAWCTRASRSCRSRMPSPAPVRPPRLTPGRGRGAHLKASAA